MCVCIKSDCTTYIFFIGQSYLNQAEKKNRIKGSCLTVKGKSNWFLISFLLLHKLLCGWGRLGLLQKSCLCFQDRSSLDPHNHLTIQSPFCSLHRMGNWVRVNVMRWRNPDDRFMKVCVISGKSHGFWSGVSLLPCDDCFLKHQSDVKMSYYNFNIKHLQHFPLHLQNGVGKPPCVRQQ